MDPFIFGSLVNKSRVDFQSELSMKAIDVIYASFSAKHVLAFPVAEWSKLFAWDDLIKIGRQELVLPALGSRLKQLCDPSLIPVEISDFLCAVEDLNAARNEAILAEFAFAASLLNAAGIEPVILKGVAYCAMNVYANPSERYLWDVDLLIPESQMSTAVEILMQNGFESEETYRLGHFRHHHPPLQRRGSVHFELHHSLGLGICRSLLPAREMLEQSVVIDFRGARVRVPSSGHMMTHLILHSQIQHPYNERIWPPLRAMHDLVLLRRKFDSEIDWREIRCRFRRAGQLGVLELHLRQVQESLGSDPPFAIRLTGFTYLRWLRRRLLRAFPRSRFIDPIYMYSTVIQRRARLLKNALAVPGGWRHITHELLRPAFYKRFVTDVHRRPRPLGLGKNSMP